MTSLQAVKLSPNQTHQEENIADVNTSIGSNYNSKQLKWEENACLDNCDLETNSNEYSDGEENSEWQSFW